MSSRIRKVTRPAITVADRIMTGTTIAGTDMTAIMVAGTGITGAMIAGIGMTTDGIITVAVMMITPDIIRGIAGIFIMAIPTMGTGRRITTALDIAGTRRNGSYMRRTSPTGTIAPATQSAGTSTTGTDTASMTITAGGSTSRRMAIIGFDTTMTPIWLQLEQGSSPASSLGR